MQIKRAAILWAGFGRRISNEYGGIHKATIMLKGKWLQELGFEAGADINVSCEEGRLVITKK